MTIPNKLRSDPLLLFPRALSRLYTFWLLGTVPFLSVGEKFYAHYSTDIRRLIARHIKIGNSVSIDRDVWLNIPYVPETSDPVIIIDDGCKIGRRVLISAKNRIHVERDTIFAPNVLLMDHNHALKTFPFQSPSRELQKVGRYESRQAAGLVTTQSFYVIEANLSLAGTQLWEQIQSSATVCHHFRSVSGNPARVVKRYDHETNAWAFGFKRLSE